MNTSGFIVKDMADMDLDELEALYAEVEAEGSEGSWEVVSENGNNAFEETLAAEMEALVALVDEVDGGDGVGDGGRRGTGAQASGSPLPFSR